MARRKPQRYRRYHEDLQRGHGLQDKIALAVICGTVHKGLNRIDLARSRKMGLRGATAKR